MAVTVGKGLGKLLNFWQTVGGCFILGRFASCFLPPLLRTIPHPTYVFQQVLSLRACVSVFAVDLSVTVADQHAGTDTRCRPCLSICPPPALLAWSRCAVFMGRFSGRPCNRLEGIFEGPMLPKMQEAVDLGRAAYTARMWHAYSDAPGELRNMVHQ